MKTYLICETNKPTKNRPRKIAREKNDVLFSLLHPLRASCAALRGRTLGIPLALLILSIPTATAQTTFAARNPAQDFDNLNADGIPWPQGLWSDGQTLWVVNNGWSNPKLYAYDLATKSRDPAKDFDTLKAAGNTNPMGIWSDGTTMWVAEWIDDKIYAYKMSDKSRDSAKDFDTLKAAGNTNPTGIWSDGATMWVADTADRIYAYKMSDKSRDTAKEIDTNSLIGNRYIQGIWSDGTTLWAADYAGSDNNANNKIYALNLSARTRDASKDFDTLSAAGNNQPRALWSDGRTMWVGDSQDDKIYAYRLSDAGALSSLSLSGLSLSPAFDSGTVQYTASIIQSGAQTTVVATAAQSTASVSVLPADADTATAGHQVVLANGAETYINITVTPSSGQDRAYIVAVTNQFSVRNAMQDIDTLDAVGNTAPRSLWSDGETMWVADAKKDKLYAYDLATKTRSPDKDFNTLSAAGNGGPRGLWSDGITMWVVDDGDDKIYAYKISDKSRDPTKDFVDMRVNGNVNPVGLWSDGVTMWVADYWDAKIYAYRMSNKRRDSAKDFNALRAAGNTAPWGGIWSDGTTMWVTDNEDNKIYAYKMSDKSRDSAKDFDTLSIAGNVAIRGLWSDGTTMWVADDGIDRLSYSSDSGGNKLYAYHLSNAAVLSNLSLSDNIDLTPSFDGGIARYTASAPYAVTNLTVLATAIHTNATVSILPTDADTNTAGHQASLAVGVNDITITVTPASGLARTYAIAVTRGAFLTSRNPAQDFDTLIAAGNRYPHSLWSDGTTMWVGDSVDDKLYAYNLVTKQRDPTKDFNSLIAAGNTSPRGLWSDGTTMWVENGQDAKIYAYNLITKQRDPTKDFNSLIAVGNTSPSGLWSDSTTMWVADSADGKIYAYNLTTKQRDPTKDFNSLIDAGNIAPIRMWSDGTTLWVGDYWDDKLYAYNLASKQRDPGKDFNTLDAAGNDYPRGIWSDGTTMWVSDPYGDRDKIYAYRLSDAATLSSLSLSGLSLNPAFDGGTARYTGTVFGSDIQTTVMAMAFQSDASIVISPTDAAAATAGHQVVLANGAETTITITVTSSRGTARVYTVAVTNQFTFRNPAQDFNTLIAAGNNHPQGIWSDGKTIWVTDAVNNVAANNKIYAYNLATKNRNPAEDFDTLSVAGNNSPRDLWSDGTTMWVTDALDDKLYAYKMGDKSRDPAKDFNTLRAAGNGNPHGLWSNGTTMWVADWEDDKLYAYKMSDKSRDPAKDFNTLVGTGESYGPNGLWSDGTTMWMSDPWQNKIYAYKMSDKSRDPAKDFDTLEAAGNMAPHGLWSDGTTMWVADYTDAQVYAYHLSNDAVLSSLTLSDGAELTPGFDGAIARYTVSVSYAITNLTIAAAARHTNAVVSIAPSDADSASQGHQVALAVGTNDIAITVTPSSGLARTYTIAVRRGTFVTSRNPAQDFNTLDRTNTSPQSMWSNGTTLWVAEARNSKIYAYKLSDKTRDPSKDFNNLIAAGNSTPVGLWSDGTTMWVADWEDDKIYAYKMADKSRDPSKDFNNLIAAGNSYSPDLWSDGTTMWVVDVEDAKIYAYKMADKSRDPVKDFNTLIAAGNTTPNRIWSDGTTMWVSDREDAKIYAYNVASKQREPAKDFDTLVAAGNEHSRGLWSDGTTMWVSDPWDDKIYAYQQPPAPSGDNTLKTLNLTSVLNFGTFSGSTTRYTATVATTTAVTTVTAIANHAQASVSILPADADSAIAGHQVALAEGVNPITIIVTAENGSAKNYVIAVTRTPRSGDNNLQSLSVSDAALWPAFLPIGTRYTANVDHAVAATTVTASARHPAATLALSPPDADANTVGHQVVLAEGNNIITVTVTASNGDTKDYILTIRRASIGMTGWNPLQDFDLVSTNTAPRGIWSNGETIWVADNEDDKLYAYNLADGRRLASSSDFNTLKAVGNEQPRGLWSDGQTMWVSDNGDDKIYAYNLSSKSHVSTNDFTLASTNTAPRGIWSNGETMWVADDGAMTNRVYAYNMADKIRNIAKEFGLAMENNDPEGMWSDGKTLWVADKEDAKLYAYNLANGRRESGKDFNTLQAAGNGSPRGLWSDGAAMWIVDSMDNKLYAYNRLFAGASSLRELDLDKVSLSSGLNRKTIVLFPDFDPVVTHYTVDVVHGYDTVVVNNALPSYSESTVIISPPDALPNIDSHAVRLEEGANTITFSVTAPNRIGRIYTVTVNRAFSSDASLRSLSMSGVVSGNITNFSSSVSNYTATVNHTTSSATVTARANHADADILILPADTDANTAGHQVALAIGSNTITITAIAPNCSPRTYTVTVTRRGATSRIPEKDFDISGDIGLPYDLWSDGTTMWVADWFKSEIRAYNLSDTNLVAKSRVPGKDFKTLKAAGNDRPTGIWSNGTTMWVADLDDRRIYAYNLGDTNLIAKSRVRGKEFNTLDTNNSTPAAIWSDGATMWVVDTADAKIYAYKMADKSRDSGKDFTTLEAAGNNKPTGIWSNGMTMWVTDSDDDKIYAYNLGNTKQDFGCRAPNKDFDTLKSAGNLNPHGIWSDGGTMWVVDNKFNNNNLYAYILPRSSTNSPSGDPGLNTMALSGVRLNPVFSSHNPIYTATVAHTVTSTTITATPSHSESTVNISPAGSNAVGGGGSGGDRRVSLKEGRNIITVDVTAEDGSTRTYTVFITREAAAQSSEGTSGQSQIPSQSFRPLAVGDNRSALASSFSGGEWSRLISAETLSESVVRFVFVVSAEEFGIEESFNLLGGEWRLLTDDKVQVIREANEDGRARLTVILPRTEGKQRFLRLMPQR